jgi:uridylate kinase
MHRGFVISVGGSVMVPDRIDVSWIKRFAHIIDRFHDSGVKFGLVAGGGRTARDYAWSVRILGGTKSEMDQAGIIATKANAWLLVSAIKSAYPEPLDDFWRAKAVMATHTAVMSGVIPGVTSDYGAALLAEVTGFPLINITNVDGVYDKDPNRVPTAQRFDHLSHDDFVSLIAAADTRDPGAHVPMDLAAAELLRRSRIKTYVIGKDLKNLVRLLEGKAFIGTTISTP